MSHLLQVPKQVFESCVMGSVLCSNKVFWTSHGLLCFLGGCWGPHLLTKPQLKH